MNYLIFDVIIALILLFALWRGYSRGFILTLCGFLAIFVAFIGATVISDNLARPVADAIRPAIERQIQGALEQSLQVEDSLASTGEKRRHWRSCPSQRCWKRFRSPRSTAAWHRPSRRPWTTEWLR